MSDSLNPEYETSLSKSALELFNKFSDIMEYDLGYTKESTLKLFAFDLYTSSPTIFKNGAVSKGIIDPAITALVDQCSITDLRKLARVDREEDAPTISEKLAAANVLLEGGNGPAKVEDVIELITNASESLIMAINSGNITAALLETLGGDDFEYDSDELSYALEDIATSSNCAKICSYIENRTITDRDSLEDVVETGSSCAATSKLRR